MTATANSVIPFESDEQFSSYRDLVNAAGDQPLIRIALCVFALHIAALYLIEIDDPIHETSTLSVILKKAAPVQKDDLEAHRQVVKAEKPVLEKVLENFLEVKPEQEPEEVDLASTGTILVSALRSRKAAKLMYHRFGEIIRQELRKDKKKPKTFSTADFPSKACRSRLLS